MALPSSGAISLSQVQSEFGGASPISISEYYSAASGVPASGAISLSHFHGKSAGSVTLPSTLQQDADSDAAYALAGFTFTSDGKVILTSTSANTHNWWSGAPSTGIGSSYQIKTTVTEGTTAGAATSHDTWHSLSADRWWYVAAVSGTKTCTMTVSIRHATTLVVQDTGTYKMTAVFIGGGWD